MTASLRALLVFFASLALVAAPARGQIPASADSLGSWTSTEVVTYNDGPDTLHVLGDSTWVALQEQTTVGCDLGPNGSAWVFTKAEFDSVSTGMLSGDAMVPNDTWNSYVECTWLIQYLWDVLPDGECDMCG